MLLIKIVDAKYIKDFKLELVFNDGSKGPVDLKHKIHNDHRKIFHALRSVEYFKKFTLNRWTIQWENGLDLAPEFLHDLAVRQKEIEQVNI